MKRRQGSKPVGETSQKPGERRKPGRPRDTATDTAILRAALELFVRGGVEAANINQVARRAGVTRASVYRRWPSREAILVRALTSVRERAERPFANTKHSLEAVLAWFVDTVPRELAKPSGRRLLAHLVGSVPEHPELMAAYWKATLEPRWRAFGELAAKRARADASHDDSIASDTLSDVVAGALLWRAVVCPGRPDAAKLRRFLVEVLRLLGLSAPSQHRRRGRQESRSAGPAEGSGAGRRT